MTILCPFCRKDNHCGIQNNTCWCQVAEVPRSLLSLLPEDALHKECICLECIQRFKMDSIAFSKELKGNIKEAVDGKTE